MLWKSCLVGCGPPGKHIALEAVGTVLDLPPPKPPGSAKPSQTPAEKTAAAAASDPKGATALQRLVQAAVWFLGENANYAASEYAWEPQSAAGQMLMMMEGEKMVMAAGVRNPILAAALSRLQRCAVASSWEVRVLVTWAFLLDTSEQERGNMCKMCLLSPLSVKNDNRNVGHGCNDWEHNTCISFQSCGCKRNVLFLRHEETFTKPVNEPRMLPAPFVGRRA
jgi:hypothetical protein